MDEKTPPADRTEKNCSVKILANFQLFGIEFPQFLFQYFGREGIITCSFVQSLSLLYVRGPEITDQ